MSHNYPRLVIAGLKGGSGKTTLSLGLIRALKRKGLKVVPFKKGPDYIDAGWLAGAAEHPCYNLDPFLVGSDRLLSSFITHAEDSDIAIIEGNRGLYDGMDAKGTYSTAEVAKLLRSPVILIVDCTKVTRTVAALILGAQSFDPQLIIRGVVLNQIAGSRHESVIRTSIEKYCGLPVLGAIPRSDSGEFPERHMGLLPHQEHPDTAKAISFVEEVAGRYLDLDGILKIARSVEPLEKSRDELSVTRNELNDKGSASITHHASCVTRHRIKVGVIRDSAFQFYYPENFEELKRCGADIVEISALSGMHLPDIDALYIGGGFPETHAILLADNIRFRDSLRNAIEEGLPVYAECGGLMYLGEGLLLKGRTYPMAGIFPLVFSLEKKPQAHGYSVAEVVKENPFYPEGTILRGHEFHYSKPHNVFEETKGFSYAFRMKRGQGIHGKMDGICYKNVLATYTHLHAFGAREWVEGLIRQAAEFREKKAFLHLRDE
ncbi:MAG: cobyrinate a,c-diamide synthase [Nitrospirae bacterium]|nr:cobyrinate a,c-diamide synthase [Nitrospirota bacterium]MCL5421499.1 cobyrinate a,c-diamide synthase [Nitrospirota bacterium]